MNDDAELLRCYAEEGDEGAFAAWVRGNLPLVYGAALRRLGGDAHGAADVAQLVFVAAARDAARLARHASVTGWLYAATRNAAINLMRDDMRRKQRERTAEELARADGGDGAAEWARLKPVLDSAMDELGAADREAVLLRYFEGRAFAEVGQRLQVSENAARMRVERAVERGVPVFAIAAGRNGKVRVPYREGEGKWRVREELAEVDEDTLHLMALATGGKFFRGPDARTVAGAFGAIADLRPTERTMRVTRRRTELFPWLAGPGAALVVVGAVRRARGRRSEE
jgi:RNA polymerase sigma factor (sigma-70 family)